PIPGRLAISRDQIVTTAPRPWGWRSGRYHAGQQRLPRCGRSSDDGYSYQASLIREVTVSRRSVPGVSEFAQVWWRLVPARGHQIAVLADEVSFTAQDEDVVALVTMILGPDGLGLALVLARDGPGPREGVIDESDLIVEHALIGAIK